MENQIEKGLTFAERYLQTLEDLFPSFTMFGFIGIGVGIILAAVFTFFGYKLIRFLLAAVGFIVGVYLGGTLAMRLNLEDKMIVILSLVFGVVFALIAGFIYKLGLFIVFAAAGYYFASIVIPAFYSGSYAIWIEVGIGLILGGLSAWLGKVCIIVISSLAGGIALGDIAVTGILTKVASINSERMEIIIILVLGLILAAVAMRYQFSTTEGD